MAKTGKMCHSCRAKRASRDDPEIITTRTNERWGNWGEWLHSPQLRWVRTTTYYETSTAAYYSMPFTAPAGDWQTTASRRDHFR